jgi:hypothetical protein
LDTFFDKRYLLNERSKFCGTQERVWKEKESEGTGWSIEGGSFSGGGIGTYSYVTLVQWNIFDEKPIFCDDVSLPSHTKGTQADPTITIIFTRTSASMTTDHTHHTMAPPLPASSDPFSLHPLFLFPLLYRAPISAATTT